VRVTTLVMQLAIARQRARVRQLDAARCTNSDPSAGVAGAGRARDVAEEGDGQARDGGEAMTSVLKVPSRRNARRKVALTCWPYSSAQVLGWGELRAGKRSLQVAEECRAMPREIVGVTRGPQVARLRREGLTPPGRPEGAQQIVPAQRDRQ
jgi:hypothetical protein